MRKDSEFRQHRCQNSTKVGERKRKSGREKFFIFGNTITKIPSAQTCYRVGARSVSARKENQLWQWHCRIRRFFFFFFGNCGNAIVENGRKKIVVAKITCEELKKKKVLRLQYFHNKSQVISYY